MTAEQARARARILARERARRARVFSVPPAPVGQEWLALVAALRPRPA